MRNRETIMLKIFLLLTLTLSCSFHKGSRDPSTSGLSSWKSYVEINVFGRRGLDAFFDDVEFMGPWKKNTNFVTETTLTPQDAQELDLACNSDKLWPTHPSQATKEYHWAVYANYEHHRLPVNSFACQRPSPNGRFCVMAKIPIAVVMSDIFSDECGNIYRGYWLVTYYKSDENMGTLYSKGRTAYPKPDSRFANEYVEGSTYFVPLKDFLFLGKPLKGDSQKSQIHARRALENGFRLQGKGFVRR